MTVNKDDAGRRSVQVEVEVSGTPEQVWPAIATGDGISSWFVPTATEDDADGVPVKIMSNFGPGMASVSTVTDWSPPHSFSAESNDLGPDAPAVATTWSVETQGDGACVVRVAHSLPTDSDAWDKHLQAWESGWPDFFRLLRLYLAHFAGEPCSAFQLMGFAQKPKDAAWRTLLDGLGVRTVTTGERVESSGATPSFSGTVERRGDINHPEELLLKLDAPAPGFAHLFAMDMGEQVVLAIRIHTFGRDAAEVVAGEEPAWQAWIGERFPMEPAAPETQA